MKDLFKRRSEPATDLAAARLTLGAFGKHPGWDDHILGLGVETETLARLKQALYVRGIGGQIDSGAWEKLEPEKRLPGFEHTFLALLPGHVLLGQLWSSADRKGRTKYPMALCIDGEAVPAGFMLNFPLAEMDKLRAACKATASAAQVANDFRVCQEQLRAGLRQTPTGLVDPGPTAEARRRFIEHPQLGPERLGFLRALHELRAVSETAASANAAGSLPSKHLRLPFGAASAQEALLLWGALLRSAVPDPVPLWLISRTGEAWLDVLISEPAPDDFFCLQASPKALPLATDIPYQLAPDSNARWAELEARFLGVAVRATTSVAPPASVPPPAPPSLPSGRAADTSFTARIPKTPPPAPAPSAPGVIPGPARPRSRLPLLVAGALLLLVALGAVWFFYVSGHSLKPAGNAASGAERSSQAPKAPQAGKAAVDPEESYRKAFSAAQALLGTKDFAGALSQAEAALKLKPGDPAASRLLDELHQASQAEAKYQSATNAANLALLQMNYREATNQAGLALTLKPNDQPAAKLLADARQAIESSAAAGREQNYQSATNAAALALARGNYQEATNQAGTALTLKPADAAATKLLADAYAAQQQQQQFENATNASSLALVQGKFLEASNQAATALSIHSGDRAALQLRALAEDGLALAAARDSFTRGDYARAAEICQQHLAATDPQTGAMRAGATVAAFSTLAKGIAAEQKALEDATRGLSEGNYSFVDSLRGQGFSSKTPFSNLLITATQEKSLLDNLQQLKQSNAWQEVKAKLADPASRGLLSKPPFDALRKWAESQPASDKTSTAQTRGQLNTKLEVMLVQLGVFKPDAPEIRSDEARKTKPLPDGALDTGYYLRLVDQLEADFRKGGWLEQDDYRKRIAKLKEAINNR